jgi:hypothetical protein
MSAWGWIDWNPLLHMGMAGMPMTMVMPTVTGTDSGLRWGRPTLIYGPRRR